MWERRHSVNIEESKRLKNTVDIELNNLVIEMLQNGLKEDLVRNLVKTRKDNILWSIDAETESKQKLEE